ncbi:MAG: hypothetical protein MAG431_02499 [Chloroflexi bacterium]|nr:hypothetical protein [Chloroflexota bacterium]
MPVRSLNSSVIKWPDLQSVDQAIRDWIFEQVQSHDHILRAGYFGSYARGDWGVGSDLDVILIVAHADQPFSSRGLDWDLLNLPVPTDVLVYTQEEWQSMLNEGRRFPQMIEEETVWVYEVKSKE